MTTRTVCPVPIPEQSTWRYTGLLKDEAGAVVPAAQLSTVTVTLYALTADEPTLNGVDETPILNTDRGTVDAAGKLTIVFLPADAPIVDAASTVTLPANPRTRVPGEKHLALIEFTWAGGAKAAAHEVEFTVVNLSKRG